MVRTPFVAALAVCAAIFTYGTLPALAQQSAAPISFSQSDRERMFADLQRDVDAMDRELSIYKRVVNLVSPSVVHIEATPLEEYRLGREVEEAGSGIVVRIGQRDYVLTNRHVVRHSNIDNIRLELGDGRQVNPARVHDDQNTDVAVLEVDADELVPARIGNSDEVAIGDIVMAFGSPFNLRQSVTRGIISGKGRTNLDLDDGGIGLQNFLQTDAAINPGNSGGPLVNLRGEVIGLNTAIASNSGGNDGIGFSIPINVAVSIARQLVETGRVDYGFIGVLLDARFDARAARFAGLPRLTGARITNVTQGSPADQAGIHASDIVLRFNGTPVENDQHLISLVKLSEVGREIELVVLRDGQFLTLHGIIGRMADFAPAAGTAPTR